MKERKKKRFTIWLTWFVLHKPSLYCNIIFGVLETCFPISVYPVSAGEVVTKGVPQSQPKTPEVLVDQFFHRSYPLPLDTSVIYLQHPHHHRIIPPGQSIKQGCVWISANKESWVHWSFFYGQELYLLLDKEGVKREVDVISKNDTHVIWLRSN